MDAKLGITDAPIERQLFDAFNIGGHVNALSEFVQDCDTPMTIAIQGDWGSGKTSMMKMVKEILGDSVVSVWFNTWQFSHFSMSESITITFLQCVLEALQQESGAQMQNVNIKKTLQLMKRITLLGAGIYSDSVANQMSKILEGESDFIKSIVGLREEFKNLISLACEKKKCTRIVIFIDDLDRLLPIRAVEMLEVLKIFLDCEQCVFLLAIDTAVVYQGISERLGGNISEEKKRSYFDKIIQMPFKMPVGHYCMENYVRQFLVKIIPEMDKNEEANDIIESIRMTAEENPRSIKRIINAFILMDKIATQRQLYQDKPKSKLYSQTLLLIMQCLQLKFEDLYAYILQKSHNRELQTMLEEIHNIGTNDYQSAVALPDGFAEIVEKSANPNMARTMLFMFHKHCYALSKTYGIHQAYSVINLSASTSRGMQAKSYHFDRNAEFEGRRLRVQASIFKKFDLDIYNSIFQRKESFRILDVGCNEGDIIMDRLSGIEPESYQYVGIDVSVKAIEAAQKKYQTERNRFYLFDIESSDDLHVKVGMATFDVIHISMLLLHLKNPQDVLLKLKSYLRQGGILFIKDIDDRLNLAVPDEDGLFAESYQIAYRDPDAGNRHTGKEIGAWLKSAGYKDVTLLKQGLSTDWMTLEEKLALHDIYYGFFLEDYKLLGGESELSDLHDGYIWCLKNLPTIKQKFHDDHFTFSLGLVCYSATKD